MRIKGKSLLRGGLLAVSGLAALEMSPSSAATPAVEVPGEVAPFVDAQRTAVELDKGDINGDGRADYLLVLESEKNERELVLLIRQSDGSLKLAGKNHTVILCGDYQGQGGGFGVSATRLGFKVSDKVGSGPVSSVVEFQFRYVKSRKTWLLKTVEVDDFDLEHNPPEHITRKQGHDVAFEDLDGSDFDVASACVG